MSRDKKINLFVAMSTSFMSTFFASALNLSLPTIGAEFGFGAASISWIITVYVLSSAVLAVPFGRLADLTGRKWVLCLGIFLFVFSSFAILFVDSLEMFLTFRVLQGVGASMLYATNQAILISAFPDKTRGKVLGYYIAATYSGLMAGPILGGFLNFSFGWRSIFIFGIILGSMSFSAAFFKLPSVPGNREGQHMDPLGTGLYVISISMVLYGFASLTSSSYALYFLLIGALLLVGFVFWENRARSPIIKISMFRKNPAYLFSNLAVLLNYGATFALSYWISIYLQMVKGFDSRMAGYIMVAQPLMMVLFSPLTGRLSDRIMASRLASFGMALCALGMVPLIFVTEKMSLGIIVLCLMVVGLGMAFFSSPNTNAVMSCVEREDYSVASSILATMRTMGHNVSMAVVTVIVAAHLGNVALAEADTELLVKSMSQSYMVFVFLCLVGIWFSLKRMPKGK